MPKMFHRPGPPAFDRQKVFLAVPTMTGDLDAGFTFSLYQSAQLLEREGVLSELAIYAGDCHVDDARNRLVRDFLETDCTDLVFIDADISWQPADLLYLLTYNRDVIGATYPFKMDDEGFPVRLIEGDNEAEADGALEALSIPTGFMRIKRHVLETLAASSRKFKPKSDLRSSLPLIFERTVEISTRWGGDYTFCRKWREKGGKIHLAPEMYLGHTGKKTWEGSYGHFARTGLYGEIAAGLVEIKHGIETPRTYNDLVAAWGNHWSVGPDFLGAVVELVRAHGGPVLECGSGLTTLVAWAAGADVHCLEHNAEWAEKVAAYTHGSKRLRMHCAPLLGDWYSLPESMPLEFALVVVDGPPRDIGDRWKLWKFLKPRIMYAHWLVDDCDDKATREKLETLCKDMGRTFRIIGDKPNKRQFAIVPYHEASRAKLVGA